MNFLQHMNFTGIQFPVDGMQWIEEFHGKLRYLVEEQLEYAWRVIEIKGQSQTEYHATLATRAMNYPEYILAKVIATFDITAVENKPLDTIIDGVSVAIPRQLLYCKAELYSDGKLRIKDSTLSVPS